MKRLLLILLVLALLASGCLVSCRRDQAYPQGNGSTDGSSAGSSQNSTPIKYSEGLEYKLSEDRSYMILCGKGTCKDTTIAIPPTYNDLPVKEIENGAFGVRLIDSASYIREVIIPDSVVKIGANAFRNCEYLSKVHIGRGVEVIGVDAFDDCSEPLNIYIKDMAAFCEIVLESELGGVCWGGEYNLYLNNVLVENLSIPDSVTKIENNIFRSCISLKKVTVGKSVAEIGELAFCGCKNLSEVKLNASLESIGQSAFRSCNVLANVTFEDASGWNVVSSKDTIFLSSSDLSSPSTAAKYLASDYSFYSWTNNKLTNLF